MFLPKMSSFLSSLRSLFCFPPPFPASLPSSSSSPSRLQSYFASKHPSLHLCQKPSYSPLAPPPRQQHPASLEKKATPSQAIAMTQDHEHIHGHHDYHHGQERTVTDEVDAATYTAFASGPGGKTFVEKTLALPKLGRHDVAIAIICCSVCFTDTTFASMVEGQVVGHEIVGRVEFKGPDVTNVEINDIVGFGYIRSTCLQCSYCLSGQENLCPERKTFSDGVGGMANASVWDSRFVYKIPKEIEPRHAGPLTCAGASVFGALYGYNVSPTSTVGIVGIGGLGHMAIKFAKAWGCRVVAISPTREKELDARSFGAHEFICLKDPITTTIKMDYILNTAAGEVDWEVLINLMEINGTIITLGVSPKPTIEIPYMPVLFKQLKVVGSLVASRRVVKKMLDFAALHNIKPEIQEFEMGSKGCREAFRLVTEQQVRYRAVLNVPERLAL